MSIVWASLSIIWASYEHHMSIIWASYENHCNLCINSLLMYVCAFQNLSFKLSMYTNLMMPNTWFTMSTCVTPMKWWIQSGISMVNTINSTVNNIFSLFSLSRVSNSWESNNSHQLFSMETNKKKFDSLYKTFSGISLVQFMVRTHVILTREWNLVF